MKKAFFALFYFVCASTYSQTVLLSEDFESATVSFTSTSASGTASPWSKSSIYQSNGSNSDTNVVQTSDTIFLTSPIFSTVNLSNVYLTFDHICKIDYFDKAIIEVSTDSGATWTALTTSNYQGSGFMNSNSFSSISYQQWNPINILAKPTNSWWRTEGFDISFINNSPNAAVRFTLIDTDNNGSRGSYGWLLDDIQVIAAACELIPPGITQTGTIHKGKVYSTGPYKINADITDASGIASAVIEYTVNNGTIQSAPMSLISGINYEGNIPSATLGDTICYTIRATDNSNCANTASNPSTGCTSFIVYQNAPTSCSGIAIFNYPYLQDFSSFTPGNGTSTPGTLSGNWTNSTTDNFDWFVFNQSTASANTGPSGDHTTGSGNFIYTESTSNFSNTAILESPCFDLSPLSSVTFSFWYHMYGQFMGELHIDLETGNGIIYDIIPPIIGNQGNQWFQKQIDLTAYNTSVVKVLFRGITGTSFTSDIAIDDVKMMGTFVGEEEVKTTLPIFSFYPNPAKNDLYIDIQEQNIGGELTITDIAGKVVLIKKLTNIKNEIHLGDLTKGLYLMRYSNNGDQHIEKLIIN